jgi:hypothetical protein
MAALNNAAPAKPAWAFSVQPSAMSARSAGHVDLRELERRHPPEWIPRVRCGGCLTAPTCRRQRARVIMCVGCKAGSRPRTGPMRRPGTP